MKRIIGMGGLAIGVIAALTGTALAFSNVALFQGTVDRYDFGGFGPGFAVPGTVEINGFTMKPGDVVPWHYHKGLSYVIVAKGELVEQELGAGGHCGDTSTDHRGSAFVEQPGQRHTVMNPGPGAAIVYWATVFPKDDPDGDIVFIDPPPCP